MQRLLVQSDVTVDSEWSKVQLRLARNPAFTALATQEERQAIFADYQAELRASLSDASEVLWFYAPPPWPITVRSETRLTAL